MTLQDPAQANLALDASAAGQLKIEGRPVRLNMAEAPPNPSGDEIHSGNGGSATTRRLPVDIDGWELPADGDDGSGKTIAHCNVYRVCVCLSAWDRAALQHVIGSPGQQLVWWPI